MENTSVALKCRKWAIKFFLYTHLSFFIVVSYDSTTLRRLRFTKGLNPAANDKFLTV